MTTPHEDLLPGTRRALLHRIAVAQSEGRAPSLVAAVVAGRENGLERGRGPRWTGTGRTTNVQYRIGSITKTFTAVLVMRLRDEGLLDLGDPLEKHLPGTGAGEVTIAQLLAHTGGLAAESPAPWWERTPGSLRPELADVLGEQPFRASRRPAAPLLEPRLHAARCAGRGAARRTLGGGAAPRGARAAGAAPYERSQPQAPHAGGWAVHPWADVMMPEPAEDLGRMAPAGQLWSTTGDLARFAVFLAQGDDRVLSAESVGEMRAPAAPPEAADWPRARRTGSACRSCTVTADCSWVTPVRCPGFLAGLVISVEDDVAAVVLANCTSGPPVSAVAADLVRIVAEAEPRIPEPWRPMAEVDQGVLELAGQWYWGTHGLWAAVAGRWGAGTGPALGCRPRCPLPGERRRHVDGARRLLRGRASAARTAA